MGKRYIVRWNRFQNMDRGGSWPMTREFNKVKNAKAHALTVSQEQMVPGAVEVYDTKDRRTVIVYQQGKVNKPLF